MNNFKAMLSQRTGYILHDFYYLVRKDEKERVERSSL